MITAESMTKPIWQFNLEEKLLRSPGATTVIVEAPTKPIWQFNIEEKVDLINYYDYTPQCAEKKQTRRGVRMFTPIFKTKTGCIMERIDRFDTERIDKICPGKPDCPLIPELYVKREGETFLDELDDEDTTPGPDEITTLITNEPTIGSDGEPDPFGIHLTEAQMIDFVKHNNEHTRYPVPILHKQTIEHKMVAIFLNENFKMGGEIDNRVLVSKFKKWCTAYSQKPLSDKIFKKTMIDLGFKVKEPLHPIWQNIS